MKKKKTFQKLHSKYQTIKNLSQSKYSSREEIKICLNCTKKITGKVLKLRHFGCSKQFATSIEYLNNVFEKSAT